jgi:hypothetical protein
MACASKAIADRIATASRQYLHEKAGKIDPHRGASIALASAAGMLIE